LSLAQAFPLVIRGALEDGKDCLQHDIVVPTLDHGAVHEQPDLIDGYPAGRLNSELGGQRTRAAACCSMSSRELSPTKTG
jgi:hypothetical protein